METVIASIHEPSDFSGLPIVGDDPAHQGVPMAPPDWAVRIARSGRGLLFFDELSSAPPAVQAALLRVVLERRVGSLDLPEQVRIVAAAEPTGQRGRRLAPQPAAGEPVRPPAMDPRPARRGPRTGRHVARGDRAHDPAGADRRPRWPARAASSPAS